MNTTESENTPDPFSEPARITRRTFVKRTGSTAIVTALALHAFRSEARAEEAEGSYLITVTKADVGQPKGSAVKDGAAIGLTAGVKYRVGLSIIPQLPDPLTQDPSASKTLSYPIYADLQKSVDNEQTWTLVETLSVTASVTVSLNGGNPPTFSGTASGGAESVGNGIVMAVQVILSYKNSEKTAESVVRIMIGSKDGLNLASWFKYEGNTVADIENLDSVPLNLRAETGYAPVIQLEQTLKGAFSIVP